MGLFEETEIITPGNDSRNGFFPAQQATYRVALESCKHLDGSGKTGTKAFIAELKVLTSTCDAVPAGEFRDFFLDLSGAKFKGALEKSKQELTTFLCALSGFDPDTKEGAAAFKAANPSMNKLLGAAVEGDLNGNEMTLSTSTKKTKAGVDFTLHAWSPAAKDPFVKVAIEAMKPAAPRPTLKCPAEWERSSDGDYALNPATNAWHDVETGKPA